MGRKAIKLTRAEMLEKAKRFNIKNVKKLTNKELMTLVAYDEIEKTKRKMMKTILKKDLRRLAGKLGVIISSKDSKLNMIEKVIDSIFVQSSNCTSSTTNTVTVQDSTISTKPIEPDIPNRYNIDKLKAYPINPEWSHVYWELSDSTIADIRSNLSLGAKLVLRLYDITFIDFDGKNAHRIMQNDISLETRGWYLKHQQPDADYIAEIGLLFSDGSYEHLLRSNTFHSPRSTISEDISEKWINPKEILSLRKSGMFNPVDFNYYDKQSNNDKIKESIPVEYLYTEDSSQNMLRLESSNFISSSHIFKAEAYE